MEGEVLAWILIALVVVAFLFLFKFKEMEHKMKYFIIAGLLILVVLSMSHVYRSSDANLTTFEGILALGKFYFLWLKQISSNVLDITGYAIKHNWATNYTNFSG